MIWLKSLMDFSEKLCVLIFGLGHGLLEELTLVALLMDNLFENVATLSIENQHEIVKLKETTAMTDRE